MSFSGTNVGATKETGEVWTGSTGNSIWYKYVYAT
jgi:hypothetical protein